MLVGGWGSKTHQADGHKARSINGEIPSLMWWGYQTKLMHHLQQQKWGQGSHPVFRHPAFTFTQVQAMSDLQMLNNALVEIFLCEARYVQMVCTAMVLEKKPCKSRICPFALTYPLSSEASRPSLASPSPAFSSTRQPP